MKSRGKLIDESDAVAAPASFGVAPKRVGLISIAHELSASRFDVSAVADALSAKRCDTAVFALAETPVPIAALFSRAPSLKVLFLEQNGAVNVHRRNEPPHTFNQRIRISAELPAQAPRLLKELSSRTFGRTFFLACGETNIVSCPREPDGRHEELARHVTERRIQLVLNPSHTFIGPPAVRKKREWLSTGRVLLSTWQFESGARGSKRPWLCLSDSLQHDVERVLDTAFVKVGVVDLAAFSTTLTTR